MHNLEALTERINVLEARLRILDDIEQIKELKKLYCKFCDGGWEPHGPSHMGPVDELFVEDAVWDGSPNLPTFRGRKAIRDFIVGQREVMPFALHYVMNSLITVRNDEAAGHWHTIGCFTFADGEARWIIGNYVEEYVRTSDGWRYKSIRAEIARTWSQPTGWGEGTTQLVPTATEHIADERTRR